MPQDASIEVNVRNSAKLFQGPIRYVIPPFQRRYVWNEDEQWDPLWNDVSALAEQHADTPNDVAVSEDSRASHFLGAVVVQQERQPTGDIDIRLVIDGQQRLTTLQLLLDAAQEEYEIAGDKLSARLRVLVANDDDFVEVDEDHFKVWPTRADREAFRHAMHNDLPTKEHEDSPLVEAHNFFRNKVREWLRDDGDVNPARAKALYSVLRRYLLLVVIDLGPDVDPQVIFETLNARGTPLLQSDLVKNYIIHAAQRDGLDAEAVAEKWLVRYLDDWWTTEVQQGRIRRQRVEQFLNYWLTMRVADEVLAGDVFRTFREYTEGHDGKIGDVVGDMNSVSDFYVQLADPSAESDISTQLARFDILDVGVVTPVLLWLMANVPAESRERTVSAVRALESYLVRRALCGRTSMGLNRVMQEILKRLNEAAPAAADAVVIDHLRSQTVERRAWPSDSVLEKALLERPLYGGLARRKLAMVLEALAGSFHTAKNEPLNYDYSSLSIEHVMPQKWRGEKWDAPAEELAHASETAEAARDRLVHTIGNLTLVTQSLNSAISDDPWSEKRPEIQKHSLTPINHDLIKHAGDVWDEATILARSKRLTEIAIQIWPGPDAV